MAFPPASVLVIVLKACVVGTWTYYSDTGSELSQMRQRVAGALLHLGEGGLRGGMSPYLGPLARRFAAPSPGGRGISRKQVSILENVQAVFSLDFSRFANVFRTGLIPDKCFAKISVSTASRKIRVC